MAVAPQRVRQFVGHRNDPTVTAPGCVDDSLPHCLLGCSTGLLLVR